MLNKILTTSLISLLLTSCSFKIADQSGKRLGVVVLDQPELFVTKVYYCNDKSADSFCKPPLIDKWLNLPEPAYLSINNSYYAPRSAEEDKLQKAFNERARKYYDKNIFQSQIDQVFIPALQQCAKSVKNVDASDLYYISNSEKISLWKAAAPILSFGKDSGHISEHRLMNLPADIDNVIVFYPRWGYQFEISPAQKHKTDIPLGPYSPAVYHRIDLRNQKGYAEHEWLYYYDHEVNSKYTYATPQALLVNTNEAIDGLIAFNREALLKLAQQICND